MFPPEVIRAVSEAILRWPSAYTPVQSLDKCEYLLPNVFQRPAWAAEIDMISCQNSDVLIVQSVGNLPIATFSSQLGIEDHLAAGREYPEYLCEATARVANPAQSLQALTVGSVGYGDFQSDEWRTFASESGYPSAFSRSGLSIWGTIKPEVVEYGGDDVRTARVPPDIQAGGRISLACPELVRSTMHPPGPAYDRDECGTSFATPKVTRVAAQIARILPTEPALLYRALIVQSARWPGWAEATLAALRNNENPGQRDQLLDRASKLIRYLGYGIPDEQRATSNNDHRTTFITSGEAAISAAECHIYQIPIPPELLGSGQMNSMIRTEVTLSPTVAQPRRDPPQNIRRYLSTWVDWRSSRLGEGMDDFRIRAMKDEGNDGALLPGTTLLGYCKEQVRQQRFVRGVRRNSGTVRS